MCSSDLHPKQLVALRSKATEVLYRGAAGGGKSHLMRAAIVGCSVIAGLHVRAVSSRGGIFHAPATPKEKMVESRRRSCCSSLGLSNK